MMMVRMVAEAAVDSMGVLPGSGATKMWMWVRVPVIPDQSWGSAKMALSSSSERSVR